jgi:hypothetical protein
MAEQSGKQVLTPLEAASGKGLRAPQEHLLCTQGVAGSNPVVSTNRNPYPDCILACPRHSFATYNRSKTAKSHPRGQENPSRE